MSDQAAATLQQEQQLRFPPPSGRHSSTTLANPSLLDATAPPPPPPTPPPKKASIANEMKSHSTSAASTSSSLGPEDQEPYCCTSRRMSMSANDAILEALAEISPTNQQPPPLYYSINSAGTATTNTTISRSTTVTVTANNSNNNNNRATSPPPLPAAVRLPGRPSSFLGDRSVSTSIRLRRQGFRPKRKSNNTTNHNHNNYSNSGGGGTNNYTTASPLLDMDFAVRSIRRGSTEWHALLRPFVADLAFRSLEYRRRHHHHSAISFRPYTCQAAVLFVDLCNYSGITSLIAHRGAHALSQIVHTYFSRLLHIAKRHGGDVVKFSGDAVLVVWEGTADELPMHSLMASYCALDLQRLAGSHAVDGTPLFFRIHCGVCCGTLESEIFVAPTCQHMQRLYHSVGGESLVEIGEAVNLAAAGQVCISETVAGHLGNRAKCTDIEGGGYFILEDLTVDDETTERMEAHVENSTTERLNRRNRNIEEDFIHPSVLSLLGHSGLNPTQIAQMRNLCILFIAQTSSGSSVNWLMEVQTILDRRRCPIVQIIDDDKGVHLVAAVNLYESIPETSLKGIEVCSDLTKQQVGCAIGMASGPTFCGVTGCFSVACRWDITGATAVRAARLMQYALAAELTVAIDQSVYDNPVAAARMTLLDAEVELKRTHYSVPVYTISDSEKLSAFRVLETVHGSVHDDKVQLIVDHIQKSYGRAAVVVTGPPLAGKKIVCQRAAGYAALVPYLHLSEDSAGFLQLARTIATWFKHSEQEEIQHQSRNVLTLLEMQKWSRAHDDCLQLVNKAMHEGLKACFLIDRVQFLDDFSLSLLRGCLFPRFRSTSRNNSMSNSESATAASSPDHKGCIAFLCVHNELYNWRRAHDIVKDITRSSSKAVIPIVEVGEAPQEQLGKLFAELVDMSVHEKWTSTFGDACGNCAGYLVEKAAAIRNKMGIGWSVGKDGFTEITDNLELTVSPGFMKKVHSFPVSNVNAEVAMKFSQIFDELPPLIQIILKIMSFATRVTFYNLPKMIVWETLNDLVADGVELDVFGVLVEELRDMFLIKMGHDEGTEVLSFQCQALGDTAFAVSTPVQIEAIARALLERLEHLREQDFRVPFLLAALEIVLHPPTEKGFFTEDNDGNENPVQKIAITLWQQGYDMFLQKSSDWDEDLVELWRERFADEVKDSGLDLTLAEVLDETFCIMSLSQGSVDPVLSRAKVYSPPIAFGPMGHSLAVIGRTIFHEYGKFRGYSDVVHVSNSNDLRSASTRYVAEMCEVEQLLAEFGFPMDVAKMDSEKSIVAKIALAASNSDEVLQKARWFIEELVDKFVLARVDRLHQLVEKLRSDDVIPPIMETAQPGIYRAFMAIRKIRSEQDATQDALMILATSNWMPKQVPEHLPILLYQSVARLRNKTLKRLSAAELAVARHQQCDIDLEAFLIVTPVLYQAHDRPGFPYDTR